MRVPGHAGLARLLLFFSVACGAAEVSGPIVPVPGPPLGDRSLKIVFTTVEHTQDANGYNKCWVTLATEDARVSPMSSLCAYYTIWKPDGTLITYEGPGGIWTVRADGTGAQRIPNTDLVQGTSGFRAPTWSPDGTWLAAFDFSYFEIMLFRPDGTGLRRLDSTRGMEGYQQSPWSPDGKTILYSRGRTLWEVDVATDVSRQVVDPNLPIAWQPRWSPDGRRISFLAQISGTQYVIGPLGTYTQEGPLPPDAGLWVVNRDGTGLRHLVNEYVSSQAWSQDGRSLLYSAETPGHRSGLFVVLADGSGTPKLFLENAKNTTMVGVDWISH